MPTNVFQGDAQTQTQEETFTPANVEIGDIFTLTFTNEKGTTFAVSFEATGTTVANVTAGLTTAVNALANEAGHPASRVLATDDTTHVTLEARTSGVPFSCAASTTNSSASGSTDNQTLTRAVVLANSGRNDYNTVANWSLGAVPITGDDVLIAPDPTNPAIPGGSAILYGLDQVGSGKSIASFKVAAGYSAQIGGTDGAALRLTVATSGAVEFAGSGRSWVDFGGSQVSPLVRNSAGHSAALYGVSIAGTNMPLAVAIGGDVGIGVEPGDTTTEVDAVRQSGGAVVIGSGVSARDDSAIDLVVKSGGTMEILAATDKITQTAGTLTTRGTAAHALIESFGGVVYPESTGTVASIDIDTGGHVDLTTSPTPRTVTAMTVGDGSYKTDEHITHTNLPTAKAVTGPTTVQMTRQ